MISRSPALKKALEHDLAAERAKLVAHRDNLESILGSDEAGGDLS